MYLFVNSSNLIETKEDSRFKAYENLLFCVRLSTKKKREFSVIRKLKIFPASKSQFVFFKFFSILGLLYLVSKSSYAIRYLYYNLISCFSCLQFFDLWSPSGLAFLFVFRYRARFKIVLHWFSVPKPRLLLFDHVKIIQRRLSKLEDRDNILFSLEACTLLPYFAAPQLTKL